MVVELQSPQVLPDIEFNIIGLQPMIRVVLMIAERTAFAAPQCAKDGWLARAIKREAKTFGFENFRWHRLHLSCLQK
jgi:hypothetical protein